MRTHDGGTVVGGRLGATVGAAVGLRLGDPDGCSVGESDGCTELYSAVLDGASDGVSDGNPDGPKLGVPVGRALGACMRIACATCGRGVTSFRFKGCWRACSAPKTLAADNPASRTPPTRHFLTTLHSLQHRTYAVHTRPSAHTPPRQISTHARTHARTHMDDGAAHR